MKYKFEVGDFVKSRKNNTFEIKNRGTWTNQWGRRHFYYTVKNHTTGVRVYDVKVKDAHKRWQLMTKMERILYG